MAEFVHNGIRYRELPNGQAEVIGPAQGQGRVIPKSDTMQRREGAQATQEQAAASVDQATVGAQISRAQSEAEKAAIDVRRAQADAQRAASEAQASQAELARSSSGLTMTPDQRGQLLGQYRSMPRLAAGVQELRQSFKENLTGRNPLEGRLGPLRPQDKVFDDASGGLSAFVAAALGLSGQQFNTPAEQQLFIGSILPRATDTDEQIDNKLRRLEDMTRDAVTQGRQLLGITPEADPIGRDTAIASLVGGQQDDDRPIIPGAPTSRTPPAPPAPQTEVRGDGSFGNDPALAGTNAIVNRMIADGSSEQEIRAFLNSVRPGMGDRAESVRENIEYRQRNPSWEPQADVESVWQPAEGVGGALGWAADSPLGAGVIGAANALTVGNLGNIAGDEADSILAGLQEQRPLASFVGDVVGSGAAMGGITGLAGRAGLSALTRAGGLGADAAYGGTRGFSEAEGDVGDRVASALLGAGAAGLGNVAGRGIVSGAGRAARGVSDPAVRMLNERGISMTPGQILGQDGFIGRRLGSLENAIESVPIIGGNFRDRRMQGIEDYGRAQLEENLGSIGYRAPAGQSANDVLANAQQAVGDSYGFLQGRTFSPDQQMVDELGQALSAGRSIPRVGDEFGAIMDRDIGPVFGQNGEMTGAGFQDALQTMRGAQSGFAQDGAMGNMASNAIGDVEAALMGGVQRQAPDVMEDLARANEAYRGLVPIENASITAVNQGGQFTPAQYGRAAANNTRRFGGRAAAARGDIPGAELQQAAQQVLPSEIPNSGTADRAMAALLLPAALGGGGIAAAGLTDDPVAAALLLGLAGASTGTGQRLLQRGLLDRPDALRNAGDYVYQLRDLGGRAGAAASMPWLLANE